MQSKGARPEQPSDLFASEARRHCPLAPFDSLATCSLGQPVDTDWRRQRASDQTGCWIAQRGPRASGGATCCAADIPQDSCCSHCGRPRWRRRCCCCGSQRQPVERSAATEQLMLHFKTTQTLFEQPLLWPSSSGRGPAVAISDSIPRELNSLGLLSTNPNRIQFY